LSPGQNTTVSLHRTSADVEAPASAQLFLLLQCEHPLETPSRHLLADVDEIVLGRGDRRVAERSAEGGVRRLTVRVPDRAMSQVHARLTRVHGGRWLIEDAGSKNGIVHNGVTIRRGALRDGDLLELGQTLFGFRDKVAAARASQPDLDGAGAPTLAGQLPSFVAALAEQYEALAALAPTDVPVMILGESGSGKELAARAIHAASGRTGNFAALNCGAIPKELVEATLFGHRRGAFSGAVDDRPGVVRSADRGTLFLDELGDLPLASQVAFLRVLQEQEVTPVGDARPIKVDFRLVAATHRSPEQLVEEGAFRHDLYARIAGFTLRLPRLNERREDLGLLIAALLRRLAPERATRLSFSVHAARALFAYPWPLNVRELENTLRIAVALAGTSGRIGVEQLPEGVRRGHLSTPPPASDSQEDEPMPPPGSEEDRALRAELTALLTQHRGNVSKVAKAMNKGRMQIHRWLRRLGIDAEAFRQ
jgi:sigma-54 dependent transcriptional regulator, acetoin dehydrogenase operon transcriptional activator AcoR